MDDKGAREFLTTEEVFIYLKTTPRTIYRLVHNAELAAFRVGREWRFRRADLDEMTARRHSLEGVMTKAVWG
jgi:excisionase family DNA binding protein